MKLFAAFALLSSAAFAAAPIGVATASGQFRLEGSRIWGNSTLFDGAKIETTDATSELALASGVKIQLGAGSSARIWKGRLELERGTGQVTASSAFLVNAGGLSVQGSRYRVGLLPGARLEVASLTGNAKVLGSRGDLLAAVPVGRNMSFAMQQTVTRAGCLVYKGNGFILQVDDSADVWQLIGGPLAENVGNRIMVTGSFGLNAPTISPATLIVNVTSLLLRSTGGCLTAAAALSAQTSVPAGTTPAPTAVATTPAPPASTTPSTATVARTGMSTGAKVGIIAAIGGGGAGAALALGGKKSSTSP